MAAVPRGVPVILDMHIHTNIGSYDSNLSPLELIRLGKASGLDGVVVTEHDRGWDRDLARQLAREHDFLILCGMEVSTDLGHILVYGLEEYVSGILYAETLRQVVDKIGGVMFAAHPYRRAFVNTNGRWDAPKPTLTVQQAADYSIVQLVDGLEVYNGATGDRENAMAGAVREYVGVRGIGGSDAHSEHGLGCCVTEFERRIRSEHELIEELQAGRFRAINRLQTPASARS
ncbi:MAG TPA: PHP domain-containing protein [Candidatus Tectomicrobia bacterium]|nr:PHP domain-containing protein [Candidatus Tectomicrobia bacterium]